MGSCTLLLIVFSLTHTQIVSVNHNINSERLGKHPEGVGQVAPGEKLGGLTGGAGILIPPHTGTFAILTRSPMVKES